jgi:hypothetical protein
VEVWEEVAVPQTPPTGFLIKMLASGGESISVRNASMAFRTAKIFCIRG